ncbi:membrane hypothetical protein [Tenacibaculum amylolyticum]
MNIKKNTTNNTFTTKTLPILFKLLWLAIYLIILYIGSFYTLLFYFLNKENTFWNLILPNITTIVLLTIYTKEILIGYRPKSKKHIKLSLIIYIVIVLLLLIIQYNQYSFFLENEQEIHYSEIALTWAVIFTSYIGLIMNRIQKLRN